METKTMNAIFSENLRNRLYLKKMPQGELAKKTGVSEASVSKWCSGEAMPRPKKIAELQKIPPVKTKIFASNWKDLYAELDEEHKRSFWRNIISGVEISLKNQGFKILY